MRKIAVCLFLSFCIGCSTELTPKFSGRSSDSEVEDGGVVESADREKTEAFFAKLQSVKTVEAEEKLLKEFGEWLGNKKYKIRVETENGKHNLSCPYFPPVTPWTSHTFLDIKNLELLPRLKSDE